MPDETPDRNLRYRPSPGRSSPPPRPAARPPEKPEVFASWLKMSFPEASAREEQIRQAASISAGARGNGEAAQAIAQPAPGPAHEAFTSLQSPGLPGDSAKGDSAYGGNRPSAGHSVPDQRIAERATGIAAEIARSADPRRLAQLVREELHRATSGLAVPGDELRTLQAELAAYKPGDAAYRSIVELECERAELEWAGQGRIGELFHPVLEAAKAADWDGLEAVLAVQFASVANATSTTKAIEDHVSLLIEYGPGDAAYQAAVKRAEADFTIHAPKRGAAEVETILRRDGPLAASARLRHLTDPELCDPLSAGQLLSFCEMSLAEIVRDLRSATIRNDARQKAETASLASLLPAQQSQVFSYLSAAADSASRSGQGLRAARRLAQMLHMLPVDGFIVDAIGTGHGVLLPLEIVRARISNPAFQSRIRLSLDIESGIRALLERIGEVAVELDAAAAVLTEMVARRDAHTDANWRRSQLEAVADFDSRLALLNRYAYGCARMVRNLDEADGWLDGLSNHQALRRLKAVPDDEAFKELRFVLESMPGSIAELLRIGEADLAAGLPGSAYLRLQGLKSALRGLQDFRNFLNTIADR